MSTILVILGKQTRAFAKGAYNQGLFDTAVTFLEQHHQVLTTVIEQGYDVAEEIEKFKQADVVIYQYPVYWFMMPALLKQYLDDVYAYGVFFGHADGAYGSGGLMQGKKVMLSTTWNAPADVFGDAEAFFEGATRDQALAPMRKTHQFCGFEELPHFSCHDIIANPDFASDRERFVAHLQASFANVAAAAVTHG